MYKIIGADGIEQGPYSEEDIRKLIIEGRVDRQTRAKVEGTDVWRTLGEIAEFESAFGPVESTPARRRVSELRMDYDDIFRESWARFKNQGWLWIGVTVLLLAIQGAIELIPLAGQLIGMVLAGPLFTGLHWMGLKAARGQTIVFEDAFAGFGPRFLQLMLAGIVFHLLVGVGLLLLLLPGIYLIVSWSFPFLLIFDRGMGFWDAMEMSRKTVGARWFWFFGFWVVVLIALFFGALLCGVGLFVALPVVNIAFGVLYREIYDRLAEAQIAAVST